MTHENSATRTRGLNDQFRQTFIGGRILLTQGVSALPTEKTEELLSAVKAFDEFTEDSDPYGEHDFGSIEMHGTKFFWKIDYYDPTLRYGSEDPADPAVTVRVLTVMLAEEY